MKRFALGVVFGILVSAVFLWAMYGLPPYRSLTPRHRERELDLGERACQVARQALERKLPGARVLQVLSEPSQEDIGYLYDHLWKINAQYEREGKFKTIEFFVGKTKLAWITPPELEVLQKDRDAEVIFDRNKPETMSDATESSSTEDPNEGPSQEAPD